MIIYHYAENGEYIGEGEAKLSPLDAKQGRQVYLIPKNSTLEKPLEVSSADFNSQKINKWNGQKWEIVAQKKITLLVKKELFLKTLLAEIKTYFPNENVFIIGDTNKSERNLTFDGIEDTLENRTLLQNILDAHDATDEQAKIDDNISPLYLVCLKILVEEIRKIDPKFPNFLQFKNLVKLEYKKIKDN